MKHRPDIDGLRGLAILAVIIFHYKIATSFAEGGFFGVDLFFVISGYLITGASLQHVRSFKDVAVFYTRRIARIFPMLYLTILFCLIATLFLVPDLEAENIFMSGFSAALFFSNIFYLKKYDYFDFSAEMDPFLHTWSLSVEEQFYLVIPFLAVVFKKPRTVFTVVALLSFVAMLLSKKVNATFYLLPYRMWEFSVGALLVYVTSAPKKSWATVSAIAGFILFALSIIYLRPGFDEPVILRTLPVLSAALMIYAGLTVNKASRYLLANRPLAAVGKLSYSAYLLHWPAWVLLNHWLSREMSSLEKGLLIVAVLGVSQLVHWSWEKPMMARVRQCSFRSALAGALACLLVFSGLSWALKQRASERLVQQSEDPRFKKLVDSYNKLLYYPLYERRRCFVDEDQMPKDWDRAFCFHDVDPSPRVLVLGDSFAAHYLPGLREALRFKAQVVQFTVVSCSPFNFRTPDPRCSSANIEIMDNYFNLIRPQVVVVANNWNRDLKRYGPKLFQKYLERTLAVYQKRGAQVILIGITPSYLKPVPLMLAARLQSGSYTKGFLELPANLNTPTNKLLKEIATHMAISFFDPTETFCTQGACRAANEAEPFFWDSGHLTMAGSQYASQNLAPIIFELLKP